jgi:hypothetical protein
LLLINNSSVNQQTYKMDTQRTIHDIAKSRFVFDTTPPTTDEIAKTIEVYNKKGHTVSVKILLATSGSFVCAFPGDASRRLSDSIETSNYLNPSEMSEMSYERWITSIVNDIWHIEVCTACRTRYKGRSQQFCLDCCDRPKVIMNSVDCSICQSGFQIVGKYCGGCCAMVCIGCENQYEDRLRCPVCRVNYNLHDPIRTRVNTKRHREEDDDEVKELH